MKKIEHSLILVLHSIFIHKPDILDMGKLVAESK